jgi:hypothetical protein
MFLDFLFASHEVQISGVLKISFYSYDAFIYDLILVNILHLLFLNIIIHFAVRLLIRAENFFCLLLAKLFCLISIICYCLYVFMFGYKLIHNWFLNKLKNTSKIRWVILLNFIIVFWNIAKAFLVSKSGTYLQTYSTLLCCSPIPTSKTWLIYPRVTSPNLVS